jgi:hypothetical protein
MTMNSTLIGTITCCPERGCHAPAEVVDSQTWASTDGGLVMVKVIGVCGHWFLMPAEQLELVEGQTAQRRAVR